MIKKMRLRGVKTLEKANRFLEEYLLLYNKRFSVRPRGKNDLHRAIPRGMDLNAILSMKTERTLRKDFTVAHHHRLYQIEDSTRPSKVTVQDRTDGSMKATYQGRALRFKEITESPARDNKQPVATRRSKIYIPPSDHYPWRMFSGKRTSLLDRCNGDRLWDTAFSCILFFLRL